MMINASSNNSLLNRQESGKGNGRIAILAGIWSVYLGQRITSREVCLMLCLWKVIKASESHGQNMTECIELAENMMQGDCCNACRD